MLNKKFNRLGGTEIRSKQQVNFYIMLCEWIKRMQTNQVKSLEWWDQNYKAWTKHEHIYNYQNDRKVKNRFNFIVNSLSKMGIKYSNQRFHIPEVVNSDTIFQNLMAYENNGAYPFQAMIDFAFWHPQKNDARKIILSFLVFDGSTSFANLYKKVDIVGELARSNCNQLPKFKKPPKVKRYIEIIARKKQHNILLTINDFADYNEKNDKLLRPVVFQKRERFNLLIMVNRLNKLDLKTFLYKLHYNKLAQLLQGDYFDLFSRWLYDFGLIDVAGKKARVFYNQKLMWKDGKYLVTKDKINNYPWKLSEVNTYIAQIAKRDFTFKHHHQHLQFVTNSTLAEYFVNLYYAYQLNILPQNFCKFVNTKVSDKLQPIFTAPGNKPDMSYINKTMLVNIETTINHTKRQIENNEIFPCSNHYEMAAKQSNARLKYLIFISPLDPQIIKKNFEIVFESKIPLGKLIICQFNNLRLPPQK